MSGRKIVDEAEARAGLAAAARAGIYNREWARSEGIDGRSLNAWARNLARREAGAARRRRPSRAQPTPQRFVELTPAVSSTAPPTFVIRAGRFAIEVAATFDDSSLRRLLALVSAC